jgi:cytochrome b561
MSFLERPSPLASQFEQKQDESNRAMLHLPVAKIFHWTTTVLVLAMFVSGIVMTQLGGGRFGDTLFAAHKLFGVCVLVLIVIRLGYRAVERLRGNWLPQVGNHAIHRTLYAACILVPLLGWMGISDFGARGTLFGLTLPSIWPEGAGYSSILLSAHTWLAFALIAAVVIHIGIAVQDSVMRGSAGQSTAE